MGRERELALKAECPDTAISGQSHLLTVAGEAGAVNTALVRRFVDLARGGHRRALARLL